MSAGAIAMFQDFCWIVGGLIFIVLAIRFVGPRGS